MKTITIFRKEHNGVPAIFIRCERDLAFEQMIRSFPGRAWSGSNRCWYIRDEDGSIERITSYFRGRFRIETREKGGTGSKREPEKIGDDPASEFRERGNSSSFWDKRHSGPFDPVEMRVDHSGGRLVVKFTGRFDSAWVEELRQYGRPWYDREQREWSLQPSRSTIDSLADYFGEQGVRLIIKKEQRPEGVRRGIEEAGREVRSRAATKAIDEALDQFGSYLRELRYSNRTVSIYTAQLELFLKWVLPCEPGDVTVEHIREFMEDFIIGNGYSASFQNQVITAIKGYYSLLPGSEIVVDDIKRPRRGRPLPRVFSRSEVTAILNATQNLKHRLILWMIYSCGLRRGEVVNIRLSDMNRERGLLHIRSGKGDVDRVVPVPEKVWKRYDEYLAAYNPVLYLFEGQRGGSYSSSSVANVFKKAMSLAGIDRDVGVHSLRHSFATHLHESGLDIRYIQELLGHRSSQTTEIYTHVSRRHLATIRSPIEDLDLH